MSDATDSDKLFARTRNIPFGADSMTADTPILFFTLLTWSWAEERDENAPNWTPALPDALPE